MPGNTLSQSTGNDTMKPIPASPSTTQRIAEQLTARREALRNGVKMPKP